MSLSLVWQTGTVYCTWQIFFSLSLFGSVHTTHVHEPCSRVMRTGTPWTRPVYRAFSRCEIPSQHISCDTIDYLWRENVAFAEPRHPATAGSSTPKFLRSCWSGARCHSAPVIREWLETSSAVTCRGFERRTRWTYVSLTVLTVKSSLYRRVGIFSGVHHDFPSLQIINLQQAYWYTWHPLACYAS